MAADSEVSIVCFGDSNTWGCPPFTNIARPPNRIPAARRWPNIMGRELGDNIRIVEEGLGGRTTVFDDPIEGLHKNAMRTILATIESHAPMSLIVIMLGTNDFKAHYNNSAYNSARGLLTLIQIVRGHYVLADETPEILVITPASITADAEPAMWGDGVIRNEGLGHYQQQVAQRTGCFYFDANSVVRAGSDGIHLDEPAHAALGSALAVAIRPILKMQRT